ncbi:MAG: sortase [Bacilli bacterium]|nr:sortase [Bacilli bacterium]
MFVCFISFNYPECKKIIKRNVIKDNTYNYNDTYIAVLEIPIIGFKRGLYDKDSPLNDVDKQIAFLPNTEYPNNNSNTVIVGHSGNSQYAYFNDLDKLDIGDIIFFYYDKTKYEFIIDNIYLVLKTGAVEVQKNENKMTLTLITCFKDNYQLVIVANKKE